MCHGTSNPEEPPVIALRSEITKIINDLFLNRNRKIVGRTLSKQESRYGIMDLGALGVYGLVSTSELTCWWFISGDYLRNECGHPIYCPGYKNANVDALSRCRLEGEKMVSQLGVVAWVFRVDCQSLGVGAEELVKWQVEDNQLCCVCWYLENGDLLEDEKYAKQLVLE